MTTGSGAMESRVVFFSGIVDWQFTLQSELCLNSFLHLYLYSCRVIDW